MVLHQTAATIFDQLTAFTEQCTDQDFQKPLPVIMNKTVGKHLRHIIEFFDILAKGYLSGELSYDHRLHDPSVEESRFLALDKLQELSQKISTCQSDKELSLTVDYTADGQEATMTLKTTFFRELSYNIEHAIHHMAILKIAVLQEMPYLELAPQFGVAYATVRYEKAR